MAEHSNRWRNAFRFPTPQTLLQQRMTVLEGIARGEMAIAEGKVVSHADAKARMARWLKAA